MTASKPDITLLGSEMLTWSDLDNTGGFDGVLVASLVSGFARRPERLLIVGPTTPTVIEALSQEADHVDVLVRSWPDAQKLREILPGDVVVHCGPLDRMSRISEGHDAVVALAGLDRLHSAEEPMPAWPRVLADLADLVGPQGELLVAVGNTVGVDALVTLHPTGFHPDESWPQGHLPPSPPPNVDELLGRLSSEHQLTEVQTWWCHGPRLRPGLVASRRVLTDLTSDPLLLRRVTGAYGAQGSSTTDALRDPGQVAADLLQAGLGAATAPLTMLHVRRGERGGVMSTAPSMIAQEDQWVGGSPAICWYEHTGATWQRRLAVPAVQEQVAPGLLRDLGRLEGEVPTGRTLADELRDLLAQHDASGAGELVRRLRAWIGGDDPAHVQPAHAAATLDRLAVGESLQLADASYVVTAPATGDTVLARVLLRFAHHLVVTGARHPWSAAATPRIVATSLAAAADVRLDDDAFAQAVSLDRLLSDPAVPAPDFEAPAPSGDDVMPYAELLELSRALAERAATQDAHVVWLLNTVQIRQRRLRKSRGTIAELRRSREYRLGRRVFWLRDLLRRRKEARLARESPHGVWRDRSGEPPVEDRTVYVEQDMVPPGYQPHDGVVVTPVGVDPGDDGSS